MAKNRLTDQDLMERTDECISELVYNKYELQKAYNYYAGKRDRKQFEYLEKNYGIGNPTSVTFTPLVKKHLDALVGEFLGTPILPKISCKDSETISLITRDKMLEIDRSLTEFLKEHLRNVLMDFIDGKDVTDTFVKERLDEIKENVDTSYVSKFEKAAQDVIEYVMQSRDTDMLTKHRQLLLDLLITGMPCFRVGETPDGNNIEIEVLDPLNTFIDRNPSSVYVKDSYRAVVRKWMTKGQILARYGSRLSREDVKRLKDNWEDYSDFGQYTFAGREAAPAPELLHQSISDTLPGHPDNNYSSTRMRLVPVFEVEWLETDSDFMMQRYSSVRIGEGIYVLDGMDEHAPRSKDKPNMTHLKINGVFYLNRSSTPFSLMLSCMDIQDKYDLLIYYRDNLIASSGNIGDWMDISLLPKYLGDEFGERIQKWQAYKKAGLGLLDTAQEGRNITGQAPLNTIFNGYDDTIKQDAVAAIELAIKSLEETLSSITGVFQERLNGIEQRDAVTNVKQSVTNSFIITKQYYQQMDLLTCEMLNDCLNQAKVTWKDGLTGTIVLGEERQKVFTALPEHYTLTDFDVHVVSTTEIMQEIQQMWAVVPEMIKAGALPPETLMDVVSSKSLTEMREKVKKGMKKQKEDNDMLKELTEKCEDAVKTIKEQKSQLEKLQRDLEAAQKAGSDLEREKMNLEYKVEWYKAETDRKFKMQQIDLAKERTDVELRQLRDANPYNDQIKNTGLTSSYMN